MKFKNSYLSYVMMYVFYYMSLALFSSLIAVYLTNKQLSSVDIASVLAIGLCALLSVQSIIGYLNDRFNGKYVNMLLLASTIIGSFLFIFMTNVWTITIAYSFVYALLFGVNPAIEAMAMSSPFRFGSIRVWGTLGYALGVQVVGFVYYYINPDFVYILYMLAIFLCLIGFWAVHLDNPIQVKKTDCQFHFLDIFTHKQFIIYLCSVLLFYGTISVSGTYIPNVLIRDGITIHVTSTIVSLAVLIELPLVLFSHLFMDKLKSKTLLFSMLILEIIQFSIYAFVPNVWMKVIATLLFKHTLGMIFIMTNLKIVKQLIPSHLQGSALALVATVGSVSAIILQKMTGYIITENQYEAGYMLLIAFVGIAIFFVTYLKISDKQDISLFN
ncbi:MULTISPECIES: MFS transporter [unclassified Granulicatella]|uniref:MFS transporter n=1 Tax=unclassified Granulicatella TaxID=2630493 RepID=UPI00107405C9|nr:MULTISPECIES: MFS transporter [unclassified Granulicatella]MBF0779920.1 MFS transporter [Granulicatella sp. 19428wC4_WM01]TFU96031.1 MFS transporter [Granulicatella sp. WM01]